MDVKQENPKSIYIYSTSLFFLLLPYLKPQEHGLSDHYRITLVQELGRHNGLRMNPLSEELKLSQTFFGNILMAYFLCSYLQGLDNDHGQTVSRARAQRLSRAHQKVTWSMLIGVTYFYHQTKQRLPV